jgi:ubiquinone/menaquinone biosynthesis C-methylase UbiE
MPNPEYILGTHPEESTRLGLQHQLWSAAAHTLWERAGMRPGHHILDIGCGPGYAAADMAQLVGPTGRVSGVDESPAYVDQFNARAAALGLSHMQARTGDVQQLEKTLLPPMPSAQAPMPLFDLAYARWVFLFVPDPAAVVRGAAALLKPGARFMIQDYFDYESMTIAPKHPAFSKGIQAVAATFRQRGGNPDVIADLPPILERHGFRVDHLSMNDRIARSGSSLWAWPTTFFHNFIPTLVKLGALTDSDSRAFFDAWESASANPHAFMRIPPVFDLIAVRQ